MIGCLIKSKSSNNGPSIDININCSRVMVLRRFRGHVFIPFKEENASHNLQLQ